MKRARIALALGIIAISIFPILVRMAFASPMVLAFYRMGVATVLLWGYVLYTKKFQRISIVYLFLSILCGFIFASDVLVWNISIQESTATQATLLTNLSPIWVGLFSLLLLKTKPSSNFWLGVFVALLGLVILLGSDMILSLSFDRAFGFAILSGILYAFYFLLSKYILEKTTVLVFFTLSTTASAVYLLTLCLFYDEKLKGYDTNTWVVFLVLGAICQVLAWLLISYATKYMRATRLSVSMLGQAIITAILATLFLKEDLTFSMVVGGCIILLGIRITFLPKFLLTNNRLYHLARNR